MAEKINGMNANVIKGMLKSKKTPKKIKEAWMGKLSERQKTMLGV